jgi:hypothetical protein
VQKSGQESEKKRDRVSGEGKMKMEKGEAETGSDERNGARHGGRETYGPGGEGIEISQPMIAWNGNPVNR